MLQVLVALTGTTLGRTQTQRSASMRSRLLDATVDCLVEQGYACTTTTEVVRRAGVSRGAQVHHFPTKQELVLAAIEHVVERRQEELRTTFGSLEPDQRTLTKALDLLWTICCEPTFAAWLELAVAARTDEALRPRFVEMEHRFARRVEEMFVEFYPASSDRRFARLAMEFAFAVQDGLALQCHLCIDTHTDELLKMLKSLATMFCADIGGAP